MVYYYTIIVSLLFFFSLSTSAQDCIRPEIEFYACDAINYSLSETSDTFCIDMQENSAMYPYPNAMQCFVHDPHWFSITPVTHEISVEVFAYECMTFEGIQFTIFEGEPICNGGVQNVYPIDNFGCNLYFPLQLYKHDNITVTPGKTYYILVDPYNGDLCNVDIMFESVEVSEITDDPVISNTSTPEFKDGDTVCVSSKYLQLCLDSFPGEANNIIWSLPDGESVLSEVETNCVTISNPISSPGIYEICATAVNSIDTSNTVCKEIVFAHPKGTIIFDTICEGETYIFEDIIVDTKDLNYGDYTFLYERDTETPGCVRSAEIRIHILQSDGTKQVDGVLCKGEIFSYKGFSTSLPQNNIVHEDPSDSLPCRDYLINVDVIGFNINLGSPSKINDNIRIESEINQEIYTNIELDDPYLEVNYAWKINSSGRTISTEKDLIISQDSVNAFPDRFYCLDLTTNYLDGEKLCSFRSNCIQLEPTSIGEEAMHSFNIYPNPFSNEIIMENPDQIPLDYIQLSSLDGKVLFSKSFKNQSTQQYTLNQIKTLKSGVYILELISGNQKYQTKLIKE